MLQKYSQRIFVKGYDKRNLTLHSVVRNIVHTSASPLVTQTILAYYVLHAAVRNSFEGSLCKIKPYNKIPAGLTGN